MGALKGLPKVQSYDVVGTGVLTRGDEKEFLKEGGFIGLLRKSMGK